jgi:hypothetical protein
MNRRQFFVPTASGALASAFAAPFFVGVAPALAQDGQEPVGGQPAPGATASIKDFDYQIKYQRAFEAMLWAMPAVSIYGFRRVTFQDLGIKDCDIIAYSAPATPKLEALTANTTTPYIAAFADLRNGPVVLELPAADAEASLYGQVVDAWQLTIADVGPAGTDQGKGGKFLFTPPDYGGTLPGGYFHIASPSNRIAFAFRSIPARGKTPQDAYRYSLKLRMYLLSQATNPPQQRFVDPINDRVSTLPFYDERYFSDVYEVVSAEPVNPQDKVMMAMLATLGIEKGKPFAPDETSKRAMRRAAIDAYFYLQSSFDSVPSDRRYWPDRHYLSLLQPDANRTFSFIYDDRLDYTARALPFSFGTYYPRVASSTPATEYLCAIADKDGEPLEAGKLYKVNVPPDMPVRQFWALTIYDRATFAFIYSDSERTTLSSYDSGKMKLNADGGVTLYVGPKPPAGLESNWLPTVGKRPLPCFRYYGPTKSLYERTFKMPDFVEVPT